MRYASGWRALAAFTLLGTMPFIACASPEEDAEELPEVVEVEEPGDNSDGQELGKELMLGPEDVGETILATGWVEGEPLENGFFLRTEFDRVIFIESEHSVRAGESVRVRGLVQRSDAPVFDGWVDDALGRDRDWDLWRDIYLDAEEVEPFEEKADPSQNEEATPEKRRP